MHVPRSSFPWILPMHLQVGGCLIFCSGSGAGASPVLSDSDEEKQKDRRGGSQIFLGVLTCPLVNVWCLVLAVALKRFIHITHSHALSLSQTHTRTCTFVPSPIHFATHCSTPLSHISQFSLLCVKGWWYLYLLKSRPLLWVSIRQVYAYLALWFSEYPCACEPFAW